MHGRLGERDLVIGLHPASFEDIPIKRSTLHCWPRAAWKSTVQAPLAHHATSILPVWHHDEDLPRVDRYIEAIRKVITHHTELKG